MSNDDLSAELAAGANDTSDAPSGRQAAHTPGPWTWEDCDDGSLINPELYAKWVKSNYDGSLWPIVLQGVWHNDSTAGLSCANKFDAHLIAAAPDYHAAALAHLSRHDAVAVAANFDQCGCDTCKAFRPVVAKAEGR